jgi:hypothetical protein
MRIYTLALSIVAHVVGVLVVVVTTLVATDVLPSTRCDSGDLPRRC